MSQQLGHIALIDKHPRRDSDLKTELKAKKTLSSNGLSTCAKGTL